MSEASRKNTFLIAALGFGFAFSIIGTVSLVRPVTLVLDSDRFYDKVIENIEGSTSENGVCYTPVVRYLDPTLTPVIVKAGICSSPASYAVGDMAPILVSKDGSRSEVGSFANLWLFPVIFNGFGAIWLSIVGIPWLLARKRRKRLEFLMTMGDKHIVSEYRLKQNTRCAVNGVYPCRIHAILTLDGREQDFVRHNLWIAGTRLQGPVELYFDERNPSKYAFLVPGTE